MIIVYVTCGSKGEANTLANHLLKKKLIACSNAIKSTSTYRWKGRIEKVEEFILLCKTRKRNYEKIKKEIKKIHSYEIPCILKIDAEANNEFAKWLDNETA